MLAKKPDYWFPVKRYGLGWGPPNCWQGWVALTVAILIMTVVAIAGSLFISHQARAGLNSPTLIVRIVLLIIAYAAVTAAPVITVCWWKGQRPFRWRWGDETGLCPQCQYNLTGNTSGICPECGHKIEA